MKNRYVIVIVTIIITLLVVQHIAHVNCVDGLLGYYGAVAEFFIEDIC
jgi:hypothetical protein